MTEATREASLRRTEELPVLDAAERRQALRAEMGAMTDRLVAEFADTQAAGVVMRCVARCREQLLTTGVRSGLVPATEAAARMVLKSG